MLKKELEARVKSLEARNKSLTKSLDNAREVSKTLEARDNRRATVLTNAINEKYRLIKANYDLVVNKEHLCLELFNLNQELGVCERALEVEKKNYELIKDDNSTLKNSITSIAKGNLNLRKEINKLNHEIHSANKGLIRAKEEFKELRDNYLYECSAVKTLKEELKKLRESRLVEPLIDANNKLKIEVKELNEENIQLSKLYKARGRSMTRVKEELNKWNSIEEEDKIISRRVNNYG